MDTEVFLIESAAWLVFAVLLVFLVGNRYNVWPWRGRRQQMQQQGCQRL